MNHTKCPRCEELLGAVETARAKYVAARMSVFFNLSDEVAARRFVELQRAKNDALEHQEACLVLSSDHLIAAA